MFEHLLQTAADEDREPLEKAAQKYPRLKNLFELGEKLEPLQFRLRTLAPTYEADPSLAVQELEKWRGFKDKDWPTWQNSYEAIKTALTTAQERVAALEERTNTDMTPEEIKEVVKATLKEAGVVSSADLETKLSELVTKQIDPKLGKLDEGLSNRFETVYAELTPRAIEHQQLFGKPIDYKGIFKAMRESGERDPEKAYLKFYDKDFTEKQKADVDAKIAAAKLEGKKEGIAEGAKLTGRANPVDGSGSAKPTGALMKRWERRKAAMKQEGIEPGLGTGAIAREAAREYREKQAANAAA